MASIGGILGEAGGKGFMGVPRATFAKLQADAVIFGAPAATPYAATGAYCSGAPDAIRAAVTSYAGALAHMDFDLGGPMLGDPPIRAADCGDLDWSPTDHAANRQRITGATRTILSAGAVPIVIGGDDSIPIPVLQAYDGHGPITILQIDAHIDWRDDVAGERLGLSSTMRRASEMAWVGPMIQAGQRAVGSARVADHQAGVTRGVTFVPAHDIHRHGPKHVSDLVPQGNRVFINLDVDAFDPSIMPAVIGPAPGGLSYFQVTEILRAVAARATIAGFSIVELVPEKDSNGLAALTAARVICFVLGCIARQSGKPPPKPKPAKTVIAKSKGAA